MPGIKKPFLFVKKKKTEVEECEAGSTRRGSQHASSDAGWQSKLACVERAAGLASAGDRRRNIDMAMEGASPAQGPPRAL